MPVFISKLVSDLAKKTILSLRRLKQDSNFDPRVFWYEKVWFKNTFKYASIISPVLIFGFGLFWSQNSQANFLDSAIAFALQPIAGLANIIAFFEAKILTLLVVLVVNVATYNDFVDSIAVTKAWVIIRDLFNMFLVLITLYTAIGTILGLKQIYQWDQALPKIVGAAILVNFSKTISGLLIDASQVVMLTFINAFKNVAAGNLLNAIGLQQMFDLKLTGLAEALANNQVTVADILGSYILAIIALFIAIVIVGAILMFFIYRIVWLWLLVATSPIAFLDVAKGIPGLNQLSGIWWEKFIKQLTSGIGVAFLLWLSFAVMQTDPGQGVKIDKKDAQVPDPGIAISGFAQPERILSYVIAMALLALSLQQAEGLGGMAGDLAKSGSNKLKKGVDFVKAQALRPVNFAKDKTLAAAKTGALAATGAGLAALNFGMSRIPITKQYKNRQKLLTDLSDARTKLENAIAAGSDVSDLEKAKLQSDFEDKQKKLSDAETGLSPGGLGGRLGRIQSRTLSATRAASAEFYGYKAIEESFSKMSDTDKEIEASRLKEMLNSGSTFSNRDLVRARALLKDNKLDFKVAEEMMNQTGPKFSTGGIPQDMLDSYTSLKKDLEKKMPLAAFGKDTDAAVKAWSVGKINISDFNKDSLSGSSGAAFLKAANLNNNITSEKWTELLSKFGKEEKVMEQMARSVLDLAPGAKVGSKEMGRLIAALGNKGVKADKIPEDIIRNSPEMVDTILSTPGLKKEFKEGINNKFGNLKLSSKGASEIVVRQELKSTGAIIDEDAIKLEIDNFKDEMERIISTITTSGLTDLTSSNVDLKIDQKTLDSLVRSVTEDTLKLEDSSFYPANINQTKANLVQTLQNQLISSGFDSTKVTGAGLPAIRDIIDKVVASTVPPTLIPGLGILGTSGVPATRIPEVKRQAAIEYLNPSTAISSRANNLAASNLSLSFGPITPTGLPAKTIDTINSAATTGGATGTGFTGSEVLGNKAVREAIRNLRHVLSSIKNSGAKINLNIVPELDITQDNLKNSLSLGLASGVINSKDLTSFGEQILNNPTHVKDIIDNAISKGLERDNFKKALVSNIKYAREKNNDAEADILTSILNQVT